MKYKRISAFILCFAMLTSTGCSSGSKNSSSSGISDYSNISDSNTYDSSTTDTSDSYEKYDLDDFSFELSKEFSVEKNDEDDDNNGKSYYDFTSKDLKGLHICTPSFEHCTAEVCVQEMLESINSRKDDSAKDVETEKFDVSGLNAAAIHMTNVENNAESGESYLYITVEGSELLADITGYKPEDREKVKALFREIASTVKYTGTNQRSTEQQFYECDLFSLNCGPEWYIDGYEDDSDGGEVSLKLSYYYAQDIEHHRAPSLSIEARHHDEMDNAQKSADRNYEWKKNRKVGSECERSTEVIFGYNAETVSYVQKILYLNQRLKHYYFNENGYLYTITVALNMHDEEGSKSELKDILDTVVMKKISDEEIEKRKNEYEEWRNPSYTFHGASFNLISEFELEGEIDDSSNVVDFSGSGSDLRISLKEDESDLEKAAESDKEILSGVGYENITIKEVTAGNNTFKCISGVNKGEQRIADDYLIIANGKLWEFKFGFDKDAYGYDKYIAEKFLESLDLSNAE